ncbi:MAG: LysR substrate-binding domain-containing protein, partial [Pseudolabrys sp.]
ARETVAGSDVTLSGTVRIGAPDGFGSFFLAPRIKAFCEQHPELEVQIVAMPRIFNLSKREADLAIGLSRPAEGRLVSRKLSDYHLGLYASRDYLDNAPPIRARRDLAAHSFISYIDDLIFAPELDYMPQVSREIYARLKSSNLIAQMNATTAGAGICVLPRFMAITEPRLVPVLEGTVLLKRSFWLIIHADQQHLARIRSVTAHIVGAAQADRSVLLDPVHD